MQHEQLQATATGNQSSGQHLVISLPVNVAHNQVHLPEWCLSIMLALADRVLCNKEDSPMQHTWPLIARNRQPAGLCQDTLQSQNLGEAPGNWQIATWTSCKGLLCGALLCWRGT